MSALLTFNSAVKLCWPRLSAYSEAEIKDEPMMFSADAAFAMKSGGPITREFLHRLWQEWGPGENVVIDSRVHMLMAGWFPCIPGWHLDDVPRTRDDGQPDHVSPEYKSEHLMAIVGTASVTRFALGEIELEDVPLNGGVVYAKWHERIDAALARGALAEFEVPERNLVRFDWQSFHRGAAATKPGWRFFIRASRSTRREIRNEVRKQVQAYLPAINGGW